MYYLIILEKISALSMGAEPCSWSFDPPEGEEPGLRWRRKSVIHFIGRYCSSE